MHPEAATATTKNRLGSRIQAPEVHVTVRATSLERWAVAAVIILFAGLGLGYSLVVPPFETPDELFHYAFARHLSQGNPLPVQDLEAMGPWEHEGTQAPLYYFLAGRLTAGIDQSDFDELNQQNPRANLGDPLYPGNKNLMLYSARPMPLRGANLAVHVGRWFSLALGCLALLLVYMTARLAFPGAPFLRWLAMLIVACIPQFAFISAAVSNDSMIILASTATIYWLARLVAREKTDPIPWWEWCILGVLLGLAALSKLQGLALLAPAALVVLWLGWQRRSWRVPVAAAALILPPALAIAGWWYFRNLTLYGDWLGAETLLTINGMRGEPLNFRAFRGEWRGLRYSFWGLFGWFSILLPAWVYRILDAITVAALAGFTLRGIQAWKAWRGRVLERPAARVKVLLALWAAILLASMLYWATFATSSQGRLLFPALSAFGVIVTAGLATWAGMLPQRWRLPVLALLPAGLLACSLYALLVLLPASYHAPEPVRALPAGVQETGIVYGEQVEIVAVDLPEGRFTPGDAVPVTLYLRSNDALAVDLPLFVQLLDENSQAIGNVTTHPGWGRNPTSLWQPGAIYEDRYTVRIEKAIDERSPLRATVYVGFTEPDSTEPLPARGADGQPSNSMVGHVEVEPNKPLDAVALGLAPVDVTFSQGIRLIGQRYPALVSTGEAGLPVTLLYEASASPDVNYTGFVQLTDAEGNWLAGYDQPPAANRFPTSYWQPGDRILSEVVLVLPPDLRPGVYRLWSGLYTSESKGDVRLGVVASDLPTEHEGVLLGTVEVR